MTTAHRAEIIECHAIIGSMTVKLARRDERIAELENALRRCHDDRALLIASAQKDIETVRMSQPAEELIPDDDPTPPATEHETTKEIKIIRSRTPKGENLLA